MTSEEFEAWRESPITQWVMLAFQRLAEENKAAWVDTSWETGQADPLQLVELKTRADAYLAMSEMTFEDLQVTHGETDE